MRFWPELVAFLGSAVPILLQPWSALVLCVVGPLLVTGFTLARCARRPQSLWRTLAPLAFGLLGSLGAQSPYFFGYAMWVPLATIITTLVCWNLVPTHHVRLQAALPNQPERF